MLFLFVDKQIREGGMSVLIHTIGRHMAMLPILFVMLILVSSSQGNAQEQESEQSIFLPVATGGNPNYQLPPATYATLIDGYVEDGVWTYEKGLIEVLKHFVGENSAAEVPGVSNLVIPDGTGAIMKAFDYLEDPDDAAAATEIERLLDMLIVSEEGLERASVDESSLTRTETEPVNALECWALWINDYPSEATSKKCLVKRSHVLNGQGGQKEISLYYPAEWKAIEETVDLLTYVDVVEAAMLYSWERYDSNLGLPGSMPHVSMIMIPALEDAKIAMVSEEDRADFGWPEDVCPIYATQRGLRIWSINEIARAIAHELFHCYQTHNMTYEVDGPSYNDIRWWLEGSAEYFSSYIYPNINTERLWLGRFNRVSASHSLVTWNKDKPGYENFIFFQYIGNVYGPVDLVEHMREHLPTVEGEQAQADALANWPGIEGHFHNFGKDYFDGKIVDSDNSLIPSDAEPLIFTPPGDTIHFRQQGDNKAFKAADFRLSRYPLQYKEAEVFDQTVEELIPGTRYSVKRMLDRSTLYGDWDTLPDELTTLCKIPVESFLLVTHYEYGYRKNDHLKVLVDEANDRECRCYFDVKLTGGAKGIYETSAFYSHQASGQGLGLYVSGSTPAQDIILEGGLTDYSPGQQGVFESPLYTLLENRGNRTLYVSSIYPGTSLGGLMQVTESASLTLEGQIAGPVSGYTGASDGSSFAEIDAWYEAWYRAAAIEPVGNEEAAACSASWQE